MATATVPTFAGSIELMAKQHADVERLIADAIALGGRRGVKSRIRNRVYFDTPAALNLAGITENADRDAATAEIKFIYFEPFYGWHVTAQRVGPWRGTVDRLLHERHDLHSQTDHIAAESAS